MPTPLIIERQLLASIMPSLLNVTLASANQEYSFIIPSYTRQFSLKTRDSQHTIKISLAEGQSGSTYFTLDTGSAWNEIMTLTGNLTIYCQSPNAGCVLEIILWS